MVKRLNKGIKKITEEQFKKVVSVKPKKKEPGTECVFYFETFNDMYGAISEMDKSILAKASLFKLNKTYCILIRNDNENMRGINVIREFTERKIMRNVNKVKDADGKNVDIPVAE